MSVEAGSEKKKRVKVPHTYVILISVVILATVMTYILPAGVYDRFKDERTGRTLVDALSYHHVDRTPVSIFKMFESVPKGMKETAEIIFFIFICGGAFSIIQATGAIDGAIGKAVLGLKGKEKLMIPITLLIFSIGGATYGMAEEVIVFIPIGVALARAVGYDDIVGVAILSTGANIGFSGGTLNPFTVGVAQSIAELPLFSGLGLRFAGHVMLFVIACWYIMRYAAKIKADPTQSIVYDLVESDPTRHTVTPDLPFTGVHKFVMLVILASFAYMIWGVMTQGFYIMELSTVFIAMGVIGGLVGRLAPSKMASAFVAGAKDIAFGALVVGIARAILVVMSQGQIVDTVIHALASWVAMLPGAMTAVGMFWVHVVINFFIPSGSGQAAATMPIMTPLADLVNITRQTAVLAFQYGDGFTNQIIPTSAALMGVLGMAKMPYERWFKFIWPLMVFWIAAGSVMVFIAAVIEYGPF
ncbi:MAG: C4-dicarboxylate ABC transporter permease [Thermovirgaceae bacterium]|nr:TIGR00366 family protein [Synergistales bacterium]HPC75914.1 TIGR00366 family protein [Synergistales bacterium]HRS48699.1 TIGR00366 family protein [Thermovirgaceae bacterium]HRU91071.1 TIGR00366 family protein [Thermovirgaceae bacterium]